MLFVSIKTQYCNSSLLDLNLVILVNILKPCSVPHHFQAVLSLVDPLSIALHVYIASSHSYYIKQGATCPKVLLLIADCRGPSLWRGCSVQSCLDYLSNLALISQGGQEIAVTLQEILGKWNFVICQPNTHLKKNRQMSSSSCLSELSFVSVFVVVFIFVLVLIIVFIFVTIFCLYLSPVWASEVGRVAQSWAMCSSKLSGWPPSYTYNGEQWWCQSG